MASGRRWFRFAFGGLRAGIAAASMLVIATATPARAEYHLDSGDVLEISVFGVPELKQRATINVDGDVSFPLIGEVKVTGLRLEEVRTKLQNLLAAKVFRHRAADGREDVALNPQEINVDLTEYRPIYINGDVAKPGAIGYRPGMTVRAAIALAGGYDLMHFRMNDPFMESADLRSEYNALWTEFVKVQAHVWRIEAELSGKTQLDLTELKAPIPAKILSEVSDLERKQMQADLSNHLNEKQFLARMVEQANRQLAALNEELRKEEEGTKRENVDLERTKGLFEKSLVPIARLMDQQRSFSVANTRLLQTSAQVAQVRREWEELNRKLQKADDQRGMDLMKDQQDSNVKLAGIRYKLQAVGEKLVYTGVVRSQLVRGRGAKPDVQIFRKDEGGQARHVADEDSEVLPGDVVDVALRSEDVKEVRSE